MLGHHQMAQDSRSAANKANETNNQQPKTNKKQNKTLDKVIVSETF